MVTRIGKAPMDGYEVINGEIVNKKTGIRKCDEIEEEIDLDDPKWRWILD